MIGSCGPTAVANLARASALLAQALPWEAIRAICASLPPPEPGRSPKGQSSLVLSAEALIIAAGPDVARGLMPEPQFLGALCRLCAAGPPGGQGAFSVGSIDEICRLLAHGTDPGPTAALWARALRRPGVAALLDRVRMTTFGDQPTAAGSGGGSEEALFDAIGDGSLSRVVKQLAAGISLEAKGCAMLNGDLGCCHWSPLALAGHCSARRRHGAEMVGLLLAARADPDVPCKGPCGWTPLMRTAWAGKSASAACRLLVLARADVRPRHASGQTALEMGDKDTTRAIREARDERTSLSSQAETLASSHASARASAKRSGRPVQPHIAAALASSLAASSRRGRGGAEGRR